MGETEKLRSHINAGGTAVQDEAQTPNVLDPPTQWMAASEDPSHLSVQDGMGYGLAQIDEAGTHAMPRTGGKLLHGRLRYHDRIALPSSFPLVRLFHATPFHSSRVDRRTHIPHLPSASNKQVSM